MSTRSANGAGSIRKKDVTKNGHTYTYWEGRISLGCDPGTGKQVQKTFTGKTQKEVREKLQAVAVAIANGTYTEPTKLTLSEWLDIWISEYMEAAKPRTIDSYKSTIRNHIKPALGAKKLSEITKHDVQRFCNSLSRREKPLSPKSIKNCHGVLHSALEEAVNLDYIRSNPADKCKLPRIEKADIQPLDTEHCKAFVEAAEGHRFENVYITTLFTGMREGEVLGLTWDCIDFKNGTITVKRQLQRVRDGSEDVYKLIAPKNGKSRKFVAADAVMDVLKRQRLQQLQWRMQAAEIWDNPMNLVFTDETGRNLSAQTVYLHCKKIGAEIGMPDLRFHDLRHSFAVLSLRNGDDVKTVQEHLGHFSAAFTLDVYGHVTEEMERDSANRMDSFIREISSM